MNHSKDVGKYGEDTAKKYLLNKGYIFITRNFKSNHREIDLIFKNKKQTVFIEVKTRLLTRESETEVPLSCFQTKTLKLAIIDYSIKNKINLEDIRLDLILILINPKKRLSHLTHYINIF